MLKKGTFLQSLLIVFAMGMALLLPQNVCADGGSWTHKDGDTRCGTCGVNSNITIDFNTLNNTAWGSNSVTDRDDLSVTGCQGTRFAGKVSSNYEKLMSISIYSQSNTIPSYCKLVRTSTFCTYMATNRYRHGASIYLFDTEEAAKSTKLDAMPDQNATPDATPILKSTDNDGTHTKNQTTTTVIYDNSTGSGSRTFTKYLSFIHVNCSADSKDKEGEEWAGFIESSYSNSWIYYATVSYNSNGGSGSMSSTSITGSGSLSPCAFTSPNPGYKYFKCWNTRSDGTGTSYAANATFSTSESVKGPITLYAIWGDCNYDSDGIFTSNSGEQYYQPATKNSSGVYEITNKGKMMWFSQNAGSYYTSSFALTTDINMSGLPYISPFYATSYDNLSYNKSTISQAGFRGTFDGKGHTISNMNVPYANGRFSAGIVGNNSGTIKNVIMVNFSYNNGGSFDGRYGAICGVNFGTVENCGVVNSLVRVDGKICGAMVGANYGGTINNSFAKGCTVTADGRVGYLVGDNCNDNSSLKGKIVNCYVDGNRLQGTQYGASCTGDSIISATRFKSGEICYKLNGSVNGGTTWYQVINSDEYPKLLKSGTTNTVYYGYEHCGSTSKTYSNSSRYTSKPNHGSISVSGSYYTATYSNWSGTWDAPTCNFSLKCTKCNQQVINSAKLTPSTTYAYGSLTQTAKVDAKCQATGSRTLKAKGYYPGATGYNSYTEASDSYTKTYTIPSLGHGTTGYTESYSWSGTCYNDSTKDTKSCKFTLTCKACSLNVVSGKYLTPTLKAHTDAGCLTTGNTTYQATGTYSAAGSQSYSATKTNDYTVAALGHGSTGYTESYTWAGTCYNDATQDNPTCTFTLTCKKCSEDVVSEESLTPTFKWHDDAGCTNTGSTTYQATGTYTATGSKDYSNTKTHEYTITAIGHNYGTDGICTLCDFDINKSLCFTAEEADATVALNKQGSPDAISLIYSINGGTTWNDYTIGTSIPLANKGDKVYMCAKDVNSTFNKDGGSFYKFSLSNKVAASGDITTLLNNHGTLSVPENAFCNLFFECTSLTTAPELPATTLAGNCYESMFLCCTSLTKAPKLPATTLAVCCYGCMFEGCSSLTTAPELPATTLANLCYWRMFYGCTSLTKAPELPATTLVKSCYERMFLGCSSLNSLTVNFKDWGYYNEYKATCFLQDVASTGTFICPNGLDTDAVDEGNDDNKYVPEGWTVVRRCVHGEHIIGTRHGAKEATCAEIGNKEYWECENCEMVYVADEEGNKHEDIPANILLAKTTNHTFQNGTCTACHVKPLCFTAEEDGAEVALNKQGSPDAISLIYSTDGGSTWSDYTIGTSIPLAYKGDKVYMCTKDVNSTFNKNGGSFYKFSLSNKVAASGDITTLLNNHGTLSVPENAFFNLFFGCTSLTTAPELPATTLANSCYSQMFFYCSALTTAPELLATELAAGCYWGMFYGCSSLTTAPQLTATTLATNCYNCMFYGCTSLTKAPVLPATTLTEWCYSSMFAGCTSLTTAPELPATNLANSCYNCMFYGCTKLATAPKLPATNLATSCYYSMFYGCTKLATAPKLPATTLVEGCYNCMFSGCTLLNSVTVNFTYWNINFTRDFLENVASTGTFICPEGLNTNEAENHNLSGRYVPAGWTVKRISKGDVYPDGNIAINDLTGLIKILKGEATDTYNNADVNGDGEIDMYDVTLLRQMILEQVGKDD